MLPRLDPVAVERGIRRGGVGIKPRSLHHDPSLTHGMAPYEHIHGKYDTDPSLQRLYLAPRGCAHLFEWTLLRLKLIFAICEMPIRIGGCGLSISKMIMDGDISDCYPLHNDGLRKKVFARFSMIEYERRVPQGPSRDAHVGGATHESRACPLFLARRTLRPGSRAPGEARPAPRRGSAGRAGARTWSETTWARASPCTSGSRRT